MDKVWSYRRLLFIFLAGMCTYALPVFFVVFPLSYNLRPNSHYFPKVPIAIDGGRVYFFQSGYSLTMLDLETGRVLFRGKPTRSEIEQTFILQIAGNLVITGRGIFDKRDGRLLDKTYESSLDRSYAGEEYYVFDEFSDEGPLRAIDVDTGDIRVLAHIGKFGDFQVVGESIFTLVRQEFSRPPVVQRISLRTGDVEWSRQLAEEGGKLCVTSEGVYVLPYTYKREDAMSKKLAALSLSREKSWRM